jgi:transposase
VRSADTPAGEVPVCPSTSAGPIVTARIGPISRRRQQTSDELWAKIQALLPEHKNTHIFGGGRPRAEDRRCFDGILFVLKTGCQWNALNATGICPSSTAHDRFQEWARAGLFLKIWEAGLWEYDELKGIQWNWQAMDGVMTKAPLGGEKNGPQSYGSRQRRRQA